MYLQTYSIWIPQKEIVWPIEAYNIWSIRLETLKCFATTYTPSKHKTVKFSKVLYMVLEDLKVKHAS